MFTSPAMNAVAPRSWTKSVYELLPVRMSQNKGLMKCSMNLFHGKLCSLFHLHSLIWGMLPKKMYFLIFPIYSLQGMWGGL